MGHGRKKMLRKLPEVEECDGYIHLPMRGPQLVPSCRMLALAIQLAYVIVNERRRMRTYFGYATVHA
jgi:hypothetical protein